jgi:hypothetical protein
MPYGLDPGQSPFEIRRVLAVVHGGVISRTQITAPDGSDTSLTARPL